ncbi:MAG: hypothetical protein RLZZ416_757 [Candidatus Parcubacteria bacterium]|jgi:preprotein translocase subunit SecE
MASIGQYLKDTRGELRHVAWPTRMQTIVYTILVALISIVVSFYLGLFDFLFTSSLSRVLQSLPAKAPIELTQTNGSSTPITLTTSTSTR